MSLGFEYQYVTWRRPCLVCNESIEHERAIQVFGSGVINGSMHIICAEKIADAIKLRNVSFHSGRQVGNKFFIKPEPQPQEQA
jgi:hypothetical protein